MNSLKLECPNSFKAPDAKSEVWLEYGYTARGGMLWYNEGNANEFGTWWRALMVKWQANEPKGDLYFLARFGEVRILIETVDTEGK